MLFTAAQAAQKKNTADYAAAQKFTAAQAAQKSSLVLGPRSWRFTAAQAAQKVFRGYRPLLGRVHCRTGSSEMDDAAESGEDWVFTAAQAAQKKTSAYP